MSYPGGHTRRERLSRLASERARTFLGAAARLERRRLWFRRAIAALLAAAVAAISISALIAHRERERAEQSAREAEREREHAEKNLEALLATTDSIVSDADWELSRLAYTVGVRRQMLERIEKDLSAPQYRDHPKARRALVRTKHRRSDLARLNGTLAGRSRGGHQPQKAVSSVPASASKSRSKTMSDSHMANVAFRLLMAPRRGSRSDSSGVPKKTPTR